MPEVPAQTNVLPLIVPGVGGGPTVTDAEGRLGQVGLVYAAVIISLLFKPVTPDNVHLPLPPPPLLIAAVPFETPLSYTVIVPLVVPVIVPAIDVVDVQIGEVVITGAVAAAVIVTDAVVDAVQPFSVVAYVTV